MRNSVFFAALLIISSELLAGGNERIVKVFKDKIHTAVSHGKHFFVGGEGQHSGVHQLVVALGLVGIACTSFSCGQSALQRERIERRIEQRIEQQKEEESSVEYQEKRAGGIVWYGLESETYGGVVYGINQGSMAHLLMDSLTATDYEGTLVRYERNGRSYVGWVADDLPSHGPTKMLVKHSLTIDDGLDQVERIIDVSEVIGLYEIYPRGYLYSYRDEWVSFYSGELSGYYGWVARMFEDSHKQVKITARMDGGKLVPVDEPFYALTSCCTRSAPSGTRRIGEKERGEQPPPDNVIVERQVLEELLLYRVDAGWSDKVRQIVEHGARNFDAGIKRAKERGYDKVVELLFSLKAEMSADSFASSDEIVVDRSLLEGGLFQAVARHDFALAELIVEAGAKKFNFDEGLHWAAAFGDVHAVKFLIKLGARNYEGALEFAYEGAEGDFEGDMGRTIDLLHKLQAGEIKPADL